MLKVLREPRQLHEFTNETKISSFRIFISIKGCNVITWNNL